MMVTSYLGFRLLLYGSIYPLHTISHVDYMLCLLKLSMWLLSVAVQTGLVFATNSSKVFRSDDLIVYG